MNSSKLSLNVFPWVPRKMVSCHSYPPLASLYLGSTGPPCHTLDLELSALPIGPRWSWNPLLSSSRGPAASLWLYILPVLVKDWLLSSLLSYIYTPWANSGKQLMRSRPPSCR